MSTSFTARGKEYCLSVIGRYISVYRVKPFASAQSYCQYSLQISHRISFTSPLRSYTYVYRRLLPTQENITTYWFYYVFPSSVVALISAFLRIFSSHFYYFLLQSLKNHILFQLKTKATVAPSFNGLASTLPFYFHLIRNCFSRSHANKADDNLLSNTPILWVVSVWLYPLLRISSFFLV